MKSLNVNNGLTATILCGAIAVLSGSDVSFYEENQFKYQQKTAYYSSISDISDGYNINITMNDADIKNWQANYTAKTFLCSLDRLEESIEDDDVSLEYFRTLRKQDDYYFVFSSIISNLNQDYKKYKNSFLNLLSHLDGAETYCYEKDYVVEQMYFCNVCTQEYALRAISVWNDKETICRIRDVHIDNIFLQRRLNSIIKRCINI